MRLHRILLAALLVTTGCYATAATDPLQTSEGTTAADSKNASTPASAKTTTTTTKSPSSAEAQTTTCDQDAAICDQTESAARTIVTLDGKTCTPSTQDPSGLDMGLDGIGWTYDFDSDDCGIILEISGVDNAAYPQSAGITFDSTPTVQLFTNEQSDDAGAGATFLTAADSTVVVESGPVNGVRKTIKGHAEVPGADNDGTHTVTFELDF